ncbi:peptidoglycan editing factor PgeF [Pseudochrobactrum sp. sp1633]|uniref:peptidoglycan editing factor PgeF n=1 Tax=Pseudochrobactrum sp. sp1633 TaxID=3036706 RepID=UPI0025A53C57|nr:peptidoglycan editing factor PgeF [Pseudochrobactrum sp. sp1633]MDM8345524.1 peptidoglycan editing factor PgeF [Pseudochrobactrum sp. sp1633]HWD13151.1 peptidoglycan editing factor PgeF [Pseudochrobactrum sp.]
MTNMPDPIRSPLLENNDRIAHGFFTRAGGVSSGIYEGLNVGSGSKDDPKAVEENRRRVAAYFDLPLTSLQTLYQVHSPTVLTITEPLPSPRPQADAMVTNVPGLILGALSADCGPILFCEPDAGIIGSAHAGWRGALSGVLENTVEAMVKLGGERSKIRAVLGPCIGPDNYEVGGEFVAEFTARDQTYEQYFRPSTDPARKMFDLWSFIVDRLSASGVQTASLNLCTYADEARFFSYRRTTHRKEPDYGRLIAAIAIRK